eukprot:17751_1
MFNITQMPCSEYREILQKIFDIEYLNNFEKQRLDAMGISSNLQQHKFLYIQCNKLTDQYRERIMLFITGKYTRTDEEQEDVVLNELKSNDGIIQSVFRMFFAKEKK